jgi:hypothetical protein
MPRFNKRTDKNQAEIVKELRRRGVAVTITNFGNDFPDLLCDVPKFWSLLEVKEPDGSIDRGQLKFMSECHGPCAVVTTPDEAWLTINEGAWLTNAHKDRIAGWLICNPTQETLSVRKFRKLINE